MSILFLFFIVVNEKINKLKNNFFSSGMNKNTMDKKQKYKDKNNIGSR